MSQENVEIAKRLMVYMNQAGADPEALLDQAAYDEVATPDHEMAPALGRTDGGRRSLRSRAGRSGRSRSLWPRRSNLLRVLRKRHSSPRSDLAGLRGG